MDSRRTSVEMEDSGKKRKAEMETGRKGKREKDKEVGRGMDEGGRETEKQREGGRPLCMEPVAVAIWLRETKSWHSVSLMCPPSLTLSLVFAALFGEKKREVDKALAGGEGLRLPTR